jgi:hypothetical protein
MPKKATQSTDRQSIKKFEQIVNIGSAMAGDFQRLGLESPQQLIGQDPLDLYQRICVIDEIFHDPCVLDTYMATVDFMNGNRPQVWWSYTKKRKKLYSAEVAEMRQKFAKQK